MRRRTYTCPHCHRSFRNLGGDGRATTWDALDTVPAFRLQGSHTDRCPLGLALRERDERDRRRLATHGPHEREVLACELEEVRMVGAMRPDEQAPAGRMAVSLTRDGRVRRTGAYFLATPGDPAPVPPDRTVRPGLAAATAEGAAALRAGRAPALGLSAERVGEAHAATSALVHRHFDRGLRSGRYETTREFRASQTPQWVAELMARTAALLSGQDDGAQAWLCPHVADWRAGRGPLPVPVLACAWWPDRIGCGAIECVMRMEPDAAQGKVCDRCGTDVGLRGTIYTAHIATGAMIFAYGTCQDCHRGDGLPD